MATSRLKNEVLRCRRPFNVIGDFAPLIENIKDRRVVMIGEASHGTKEFYEWRNFITKELIQNHGFQFVAVEGDWPTCQRVDQFINHDVGRGAFQVLSGFTRWPTWMWGNHEVKTFVEWLKGHCTTEKKRVGFHGLDLYSFYDSIHEVLRLLDQSDSDLARKAKELYSCFDPYLSDERAYIRSLVKFPRGCEEEATNAMRAILEKNLDDQDFFDAAQNARVVKDAESYYRSLISADDQSWNIRDLHMTDTLEMLLKHYGDQSKGIVWAHNTHVGDYRATDMLVHDQINIGGLARERWGNRQVALIGFSTFKGEVVASHAWEGPIEIFRVPPAKSGSLEKLLYEVSRDTGVRDFYLDFSLLSEDSPLNEWIAQRAIGVVYQSDFESRSNYVPSRVAQRYDALIYLEETHALHPLHLHFSHEKVPETYPFGNRI